MVWSINGWLRPCCSYLKGLTNALKLDVEVSPHVFGLAKEMEDRTMTADPVRIIYSVSEILRVRIGCDASNLAIGAL